MSPKPKFWKALVRPALLAACIGLPVGWFVAELSEQSGKAPPEVLVLVAASAADVVGEFSENYESRTGTVVRVAAGPSNGLARQIAAGAPADLFVSASPRWAEYLEEKGLIKRKQVALLRNQLVLVVPRGNPAAVRRLSDLSGPGIERVALAGENVPAGEYAEAALRSQQLLTPLQESGRIVRGHDVRVTLGYVERCEVAAGIVYATDAVVTDRVEIVQRLDPAWYPPIRYPAILVKGSSPAGQAFFEALVSEDNESLFRKHGFTPGVAMKEGP